MHHFAPSWLLRFTLLLASLPAAAQSTSPPDPRGRWITASGNLEVNIAPCGTALCGTVVTVLANRSMSRDGAEMQPADTRPALGMTLLQNFVRADDGDPATPATRWSGTIYNRENGKTYRCRMSIDAGGELALRAYVGLPLFGKTQHWRRAGAAAETAPEFSGIDGWFNSAPLTMAQLLGKVVLIDFWTHDCVNCIHTVPHLQRWHERYREQGLVIIGVHTPEFAAERETANLQAAIKRWGIGYPVAQDNRAQTWNVWHNKYWPTVYLVDRTGHIVLHHVGEGGYEQIEERIRQVLGSRQ